jgi:spore coat polysaccharide biosynthesis protein SpsF (cytidylyltransferase family)
MIKFIKYKNDFDFIKETLKRFEKTNNAFLSGDLVKEFYLNENREYIKIALSLLEKIQSLINNGGENEKK